MKTQCERCRTDLAPDGPAAICSFECTFCTACADEMAGLCPNCGGELVARPRRVGAAAGLAKSLAGRLATEARNFTAARKVPHVSVERLIDASPADVFELLVDPAAHARIDGSGTITGNPSGPSRLALGSKFSMGMNQKGVPYRSTNEVVEFEEGKLVAWATYGQVAGVRAVGGQIWRYELSPVGDGTLVRHTYDWSRARAPRVTVELGGFPERAGRAMAATLERLARIAETGAGA